MILLQALSQNKVWKLSFRAQNIFLLLLAGVFYAGPSPAQNSNFNLVQNQIRQRMTQEQRAPSALITFTANPSFSNLHGNQTQVSGTGLFQSSSFFSPERFDYRCVYDSRNGQVISLRYTIQGFPEQGDGMIVEPPPPPPSYSAGSTSTGNIDRDVFSIAQKAVTFELNQWYGPSASVSFLSLHSQQISSREQFVYGTLNASSAQGDQHHQFEVIVNTYYGTADGVTIQQK